MPKVIVCNIVSIDGFSAGAGGNVMALPMDHAFNEYNAERLRSAGTLLLGRATWAGFRSFWPAVANDERADDTNREISRLNGAVPKVVISDSLPPVTEGPWANTTVVRRADAHTHVAALRRGEVAGAGDGDILVFGSGTTWNDLLAAGQVDELHLMVGNVVLGDGVPALPAPLPVALTPIGTRTWAGSGNLLVRYAVGPLTTREGEPGRDAWADDGGDGRGDD